MADNVQFPLRLGSPETFALVRDAFREASFDEVTLLKVLRIPALSELASLKRGEVALDNLPAALACFIKVFLFGEAVPREEFGRAIDAAALAALMELDLVREGTFAGGCIYTPVFLYPVGGHWIVSDRQTNADGSPYSVPQDTVFAAIFPGTLRFLLGIPPLAAGEGLDLCSGTGIGALVMSRNARKAVATDITERSGHFMRFNAALNDCPNVEVSIGDLYEAVAGRQFDQIIAHPPYVPSLGDNMIFRDGGEAGETILRRIVEGLPAHLHPNGVFYAMGVGLDTKEGRLEERARRWLGSAQAEFDVMFAFGDEKSPRQAVDDIAQRGRSIQSLDVARLERAFQEIGTVRLAYGALLIRRRATGESSVPWTTRPRLSTETRGEDFAWLLEWRRLSTRAGWVESLADARPRLSPHLRVNVAHVVQGGALVPAEFLLDTSRPFATTTKVDGWVVPLIAGFDGTSTVKELHAAARVAEAIPETFGVTDFAKLIAMLIERGCLVV